MAATLKVHNDGLSYWSEWLDDIEGGMVCGQGTTAEQAEEDAQRKLEARNAILNLSPRDRLVHLLNKENSLASNTLCHDDMDVAIRMIAKIILKDEV
jgi:hypothetical protein